MHFISRASKQTMEVAIHSYLVLSQETKDRYFLQQTSEIKTEHSESDNPLPASFSRIFCSDKPKSPEESHESLQSSSINQSARASRRKMALLSTFAFNQMQWLRQRMAMSGRWKHMLMSLLQSRLELRARWSRRGRSCAKDLRDHCISSLGQAPIDQIRGLAGPVAEGSIAWLEGQGCELVG